jgi:hypothetical protein
MKLRNTTKNRNATANEIAKSIIADRLECCFYFQDNNQYEENYTEEFLTEISRHLNKHINSIVKKLNSNNDNIEYY